MSTPSTNTVVVVQNDDKFRFTATQDWFTFNIDRWRTLFPLVDSDAPRVLEIGSWEGRSGVFLLQELCKTGGSIVCIDHFDLLKTDAGKERHAKVLHNLRLTGQPFRVMESFSFPALMTLLEEEMVAEHPGFDWIYVDGSHEADDTFLDGELVWRLAKKGAVVIFDDYMWNTQPEDSIHHPKRGIDAFMVLHAGEFDVLSSPTEYQMILRKTSEMRIGFLVAEAVDAGSKNDIYHEILIALTVDSGYAMPAAVAIRSALEYTKGRVTFYVVDLGLSAEDKQNLRSLTENAADATMVFVTLPAGGSLASMPPTWAKIAMIDVLPVERILYVDADILVRSDLRELWNVDLQGKTLGAVPDIGFPMGHSGIERAPYFNAGVLMMDLAKLRARLPELVEKAGEMRGSVHADQDVLNAVLRDEWCPLDLKWNAQGLGTYAKCPSPERDALDLTSLDHPAIVHFTGPMNPSMAEVLNPYVQPFTAKPWGYAGAPGHPFAEEWWVTLEMTAWTGWRASGDFAQYRVAKEKEAMEAGCEAFRRRLSTKI